MQHEGKPQFISAHSGHTVKGVAFSPKDRYVFCSGGTDGRVIVYNALHALQTMSARITNPHTMKNINAVRFNADGSRILTTTSKRLSVIDAESGELLCSYDNCAWSGKNRVPLAPDPWNPHLTMLSYSNGKGLITIDLRKPEPANFAPDVHSSLIRDIIYLDESWPFGRGQRTIVSLSEDGICKIRSDDRELHVFDVKHRSNCVTATPDNYSNSNEEGFEATLMVGGDCLSGYMPGDGISQEPRFVVYEPGQKLIQKLKYTSNGHLLYTISSGDLTKGAGGIVRRYKRTPNGHQLLGQVYSHSHEILDMDISPNDEFLVTASRDGSVGLMCLGAPSFGWTGFMQWA